MGESLEFASHYTIPDTAYYPSIRSSIRLTQMAETLWSPASYRPSEFFGELADLFDKLKESLGLELDEYLVLVKQYVKRKLTAHQLRHCVLEVLADECLYVHDRFIQVLSKGCHLDKVEKLMANGQMIPPASVVNALLVLRSLENGWAVPDPNAGHLLNCAIKGILADRIDCAAHISAAAGMAPQSQVHSSHRSKSIRKASPLNEITTADLYDSFSNCEHPVGSKTSNFLRMKCHADFFLKLESSVIRKTPQTATAGTALYPKSLPTAETTIQPHFTRIPDDLRMEVLVATEIFESVELSVAAVQDKIRTPVEEPSSRISRSRAREHVSKVVPDQAVDARAFLLKPGLEQHLEKVEVSIEARPQISGITSFSNRAKPVKRKLSAESDALSTVQQSKAMSAQSRPSRKSAKVIPQAAGTSSLEQSYSYTVEGAHVVKKPSSSRVPQLASQHVSPTIVRENISAISKHHVSFERDIPSETPPPAEPLTKFSSRSAEDLYRKVVEFSSASKRNKREPASQPTTTKPRARKSEGTAATRHSPRVSTAQAIIDAWRASSFEVLPANTFISPTKRDTSATKELFRDLPKKSSIDDSLPIGKSGLRSGKEAKSPAASTSKNTDKADEKAKSDASKKQSKDQKIEKNVTAVPSVSQKDPPSDSQKSRPKEPHIRESRRKQVEDSKKPAEKDAVTTAKETPSSKVRVEKSTSRARSPQKIKMGPGEAIPSTASNKDKSKPAKSSDRESKTSPTSRRRIVTSESSPYTSPERTQSADHKQGKKSGRQGGGTSDKPSTHRAPIQHPKAAEQSKKPVEFSIPSIQNYKIPKLPKAQTSFAAKPVGGTTSSIAESNPRVTRSAKVSVSFSSGDDSDLRDASRDGRSLHKKLPVKNLPQKSVHSASISPSSSLEKMDDSRSTIERKKDRKERARPHHESKTAGALRSSSQSSMDDDSAHTRKLEGTKHIPSRIALKESASKRHEKHRTGRHVSGDDSSESMGERRSSRRR